MRRSKLLLTLVVALAPASVAFGLGKNVPQDVRFTGNIVEGTSGTARSSSLSMGSKAFITCKIIGGVYVGADGPISNPPMVRCEADERTATSTAKWCTSGAASVVAAAAAMNGDSFVTFEAIPDGQPYAGSCLSLVIDNGSLYPPKGLF